MTGKVSGRGLPQVMLLVVMVLLSATANAQRGGLYLGGDISQIQYKEPGFDAIKPLAIGFAAGHRFNPNFALEARIGTGISDDSVRVDDFDIKAKIDNYVGLYGKAIMPLNYLVELYGLVGYTHARLEARAFGQSQITSDNDFSYGLGAAFEIAYNMSIEIEWARLFDSSDYETDSIRLGIRFSW